MYKRSFLTSIFLDGFRVDGGAILLCAPIIFCTALLAGCVEDDETPYPGLDKIIRKERLDLLLDEAHQFQTRPFSTRAIEYQPIRKWGVIFADGGPFGSGTSAASMAALAIPGAYMHIPVYLGKDARGYAFAAKMNVGPLESGGDLRMFSIGQGYSENPPPSGAHVFSTHTYVSRPAARQDRPQPVFRNTCKQGEQNENRDS